MEHFLEQVMRWQLNMIKLPLNVMVSNMETITKTMHEMQLKSQPHDDADDTDGTDEEMAALLSPWAGQRARAVALLQLHSGHRLPRRAPRATITDHRGW